MTPDIALENLEWVDESLTSSGDILIRLDASLVAFDGNYRAAMQRIERFMHTLKAAPDVKDVSLQSSPVNADSSSTLSGRTNGNDTLKASVARFGLSLRYHEAAP